MASITIRNVPDAVRDEIAARAARSGRSMQEYLVAHFVKLVEKPDQDELWRQIRERVERSGVRLTTEQILEARDADRR